MTSQIYVSGGLLSLKFFVVVVVEIIYIIIQEIHKCLLIVKNLSLSSEGYRIKSDTPLFLLSISPSSSVADPHNRGAVVHLTQPLLPGLLPSLSQCWHEPIGSCVFGAVLTHVTGSVSHCSPDIWTGRLDSAANAE